MMHMSDEGRNYLKRKEEWVNHVYQDRAGKRTIGWGHLVKAGETFPPTITLEEGEEILSRDLQDSESLANDALANAPTDCQWPEYAGHYPDMQPQFDALVSLIFNIGRGHWLGDCTTRRCLESGDWQGAADGFLLWRKSTRNGVRSNDQNLMTRRREERNMFLCRPLDTPLDVPWP